MKRLTGALYTGVWLLLLLTGCTGGQLSRFQYTYTDVFDTVTTFVLYDTDSSSADVRAAALHERLARLHRLYSIYDAYEDTVNVYTVNAQAGKPVKVEPELFSMLAAGQEAYALSGGRVNIAMGSVLRLWHTARTAALAQPDTASLPDPAALQAAAAHCDIRQMVLDQTLGTVTLTDPEMSLDVGAIAKGYAAQRLAEYAKELHISGAILSIGGNVVTVGTKNGAPFVIGIEDPKGGEAYAARIQVTDTAVVTSGNYQRYFTVDGVRYHHLIDPDTLYPASYFAAVSVVGADSGTADALSTALFLLPLADGQALLEKMDGYEALWIAEDGTQTASAGFARYTENL